MPKVSFMEVPENPENPVWEGIMDHPPEAGLIIAVNASQSKDGYYRVLSVCYSTARRQYLANVEKVA